MLGVAGFVLRGARRGAMTAKRANKNFYKGRGAKSTGFISRKGTFIPDPYKRVHFVVPNLEGCEMKPYVSYKAPLTIGKVPTMEDILKK
eukprot:m.11127 g.11127  ORF g.11127 m.11127 type:complete len:89 (-) comp3779_c3_seq1:199-465(-)